MTLNWGSGHDHLGVRAQRTERMLQNQVLKTINTCKSLRGERQPRKLSQSSQEGRRKIQRDEQEKARS